MRTTKRFEQIQRMHAAGLSCAEIARQLGISRQAVHDHLMRRGLLLPGVRVNRKWTEVEVRMLHKRYLRGDTLNTLANEQHTDAGWISRLFAHYGLPTRGRGRGKIVKDHIHND